MLLAEYDEALRSGKCMKSWSEAVYWKSNREWYVVNQEKDRFELTKMAPTRAIDSFKMYLEENNLPSDPLTINYQRTDC